MADTRTWKCPTSGHLILSNNWTLQETATEFIYTVPCPYCLDKIHKFKESVSYVIKPKDHEFREPAQYIIPKQYWGAVNWLIQTGLWSILLKTPIIKTLITKFLVKEVIDVASANIADILAVILAALQQTEFYDKGLDAVAHGMESKIPDALEPFCADVLIKLGEKINEPNV